MTELHYDAFISYASEDVHSAKRLADDLTRHNLSVWIDRASLSGGEQWEESIRYAISQSKLFIILLSPFCVHKHGFIQDELYTFHSPGPTPFYFASAHC